MRDLHRVIFVVGALLANPVSAGTIESIDLGVARESTIVAGPVWLPPAEFRLEVGVFGHTFDYSKLLVDDYGASGSKDFLAAGVDLGALFAEELGRQARELGIVTGGGGWRVSGTVEDVLLKNREIPWGPLVFSGHVDVRLDVAAPTGETTTVRFRFRPTSLRFNAGFGAKDENVEAVAQALIESAQEALARLNRRFFGLPPHPRVADKLADVRRAGARPEEADIRWLGLSGAAEAVEPLLAVLRGGKEESARAEAVEALLLLGAEQALPELRQSYAKEDEDVRCAILAAVPELDSEGGVAWLASGGGVRDKNKACRHIALRRMGRAR